MVPQSAPPSVASVSTQMTGNAVVSGPCRVLYINVVLQLLCMWPGLGRVPRFRPNQAARCSPWSGSPHRGLLQSAAGAPCSGTRAGAGGADDHHGEHPCGAGGLLCCPHELDMKITLRYLWHALTQYTTLPADRFTVPPSLHLTVARILNKWI